MSLLSLQNISVVFNNKPVIRNFNMDINSGDKIAIKGDSGSGKSTLLSIILGLKIPDEGQLVFNGNTVNSSNISDLRNSISWLPQNVSISVEGVFDFIMLPFSYKQNRSISPTKEQVNVLIKKFRLDQDIYTRKMSEISIGEKQRLLMIRGLLLNRPILVLDEPTAALDSRVKTVIINFLFKDPGLTIISASHDQDWLDNCNKVFEFNK
ncbi:MAG: ATP-binding cassette domain-containing protein [Bacteroidales bacterium]|nr:ATP-binding cassette domain-containing protein [Bacteroidales bacterium]